MLTTATADQLRHDVSLNKTMRDFTLAIKDSNPEETGNISNSPAEHRKYLEEAISGGQYHYFHLYLKIWYYVGVIPFKLTFNLNAGNFQILKLSKFQGVCGAKYIFNCVIPLPNFSKYLV